MQTGLMETNPTVATYAPSSLNQRGPGAKGLTAADGRDAYAEAVAKTQRLRDKAEALLLRVRALSASSVDGEPDRCGPADETDPSPITALLVPAGSLGR